MADLNWSVVIGLAAGIGLPAIYGLFFLVRMENRVTQLENSRADDQKWRATVTTMLSSISRDLNRLIGANEHANRNDE